VGVGTDNINRELYMIYTIKVQGCDDSTYFDMELSEEEYSIIKRVADKCTEESTYACMPTMEIEKKE
jgi:hypothetical protein